MNRMEFSERINNTTPITEAMQVTIETVYTWHPAISETKGKDQTAQLFNQFGMSIINDMLKTATDVIDATNTVQKIEHLMTETISEYHEKMQEITGEYNSQMQNLRESLVEKTEELRKINQVH